jgi:hypothetical protein
LDYTLFTAKHASSPVFCDYLDVTCRPKRSFVPAVRSFLDRLCCEVRYADEKSVTVAVGAGVIRLDIEAKWHRVSASGKVLSYLRSVGAYGEYLHILSEVPHTITRLDAACDYKLDTPAVFKSLDRHFPDDRISFSRKALTVTRLLSKRSDGKLTGTWYGGHRQKAMVSVRVYDKANEVAEKEGLYLLTHSTRVEFTARKAFGACLRDAFDPTAIYYAMGSPTLLRKPADVGSWHPVADFTCWAGDDVPDQLPYEIFKRRLNSSSEIDRLALLAAELGLNGVKLAVRVFEEKLLGVLSAEELRSENPISNNLSSDDLSSDDSDS